MNISIILKTFFVPLGNASICLSPASFSSYHPTPFPGNYWSSASVDWFSFLIILCELNIQCIFLCLVSCNLIISRFILLLHVWIVLLLWLINIPLYGYTTICSINLPGHGYLGSFEFGALINKAAVNICAWVFAWTCFLSVGQILRSAMAGSYNSCKTDILRNR